MNCFNVPTPYNPSSVSKDELSLRQRWRCRKFIRQFNEIQGRLKNYDIYYVRFKSRGVFTSKEILYVDKLLEKVGYTILRWEKARTGGLLFGPHLCIVVIQRTRVVTQT